MKLQHVWALLLALALLLGLFAGCAKTETPSPAAAGEPAAAQAESPAPSAEASAPSAEASADTPEPALSEASDPVTAGGSAAAGAGSSSPSETKAPAEDGTYTSPGGISYPLEGDLTLSMTQVFNQTSYKVFGQEGGTYGDAVTVADLMEATGVRLEFEMFSESTFTELLNLRVASGDYPDIWGRSCGTTYGMDMDLAIDDEVVLDFSGLIEENAPDWWTVIQSDEDYAEGLYTAAGAMCTITGYAIAMSTDGMFIRADWRDETGLDNPETIDEMTQLLYAIHDNHPELPLTLLVDQNLDCGLATYFNCGNCMGFDSVSFQLEAPGSTAVQPVYASEGYIRYLGWLSGLYRDGIITDAFLSTGRISGNFESTYMGGQTAVWTENAKYVYANAAAIDGTVDTFLLSLDGNHFTTDERRGGSMVTNYLSGTCRDPAAALRFFNYGFCQPGMDLVQLGLEDVTYTVDEAGDVGWTDLVTANPDGWSTEEAKYVYLTDAWMPTAQEERALGMVYDPEVLAAYQLYTARDTSGADDAMVIPTDMKLTSEQTTAMNAPATDVLTIINEAALKFIVGNMDEEGYRDAIQRAYDAGMDSMTAIEQEAYDAWLAENED